MINKLVEEINEYGGYIVVASHKKTKDNAHRGIAAIHDMPKQLALASIHKNLEVDESDVLLARMMMGSFINDKEQ